MLEACNVDKESFHKKLEDLKNYHISDKSTKLSQVVEQMEKTFSIREACFFAISNMSKMVEMETASELIKVLKGFKE
jgi:inorganic pyrophosphatase/exopolyphosphatase